MEFNRTRVARFQEQDCSLTLREAVDEYYTINSHLFSRPDPKTPWTHLLVHHDIGHVFFGVNTSILDEAAGDIWTLMGTDMTFREYAAYANTPEGKKLVKEIGPWLIIKSLIYSPQRRHALDPRGEMHSADTIQARLTMRDFMDTLRASGVDTGGPSVLTQRDRQLFAKHLDHYLTSVVKKKKE